MADWELAKENFVPLKTGRIIKGEAAAPGKPSAAAVEERRKQFWRELAEYQGQDPLEVWLRFVKWTQETFKAGGPQAELVPLLERCTRELQDDARYRDDARYLRVWIQYADCLPEPRDVFAFLKEHGIGQGFALYYIAYAAYLELKGSYAKALETYNTGLDRLAYPVDKLRSKFQAFQQRMARRVQKKVDSGAPDPEEQPVRAALGALGSRPGPHRAPPPGGRAALPLDRRPAKRRAGAAANTTQPTALTVYEDEGDALAAGGEQQAPEGTPGGTGAGGPLQPRAWAALGSQQQTTKENTLKAGQWGGARLKQRQRLVPGAAPLELDIPMDEEFQAEGEAAAAAAAEPTPQRLRPALQPRTAAASAAPEGAGKGDSRSKAKGALASLRRPLSGSLGPQGAPSAASPQGKPSLFARKVAARAAAEASQQPQEPARQEPVGLEKEGEEERHAAVPPAGLVTGSAEALAAPSGLSAGHSAAQQAQQADVTLHTRRALDSVGDFFGGVLPSDAPWGLEQAPGGGHSGGAAAAEPTVTLSTRAAFAAVNELFTEPGKPSDAPAADQGPGLESGAGGLSSPIVQQQRQQQEQEPEGGLLVREDTGFLVREEDGGFAVREDTQMIPRRDNTSAIREDTQFLTGAGPGPAAGPAPQQELYEDTRFMSENLVAEALRPRARAPDAAHALRPSGQQQGNPTADPLGDDPQQLYEDTRFMSENLVAEALRPRHRPAEHALQPLGGGPGGNGADPSSRGSASAAGTPEGDGSGEASDKENAGEGGPLRGIRTRAGKDIALLSGRSVHSVRSGALTDVSPVARRLRGIELEESGESGLEEGGVPPLEALRQAGSSAQDEFEPYRPGGASTGALVDDTHFSTSGAGPVA